MNDPGFATAEGLRLLLLDLAYAGRRAWQDNPDAAELMAYTLEKYSGLAHKYGLQPTEAADAAFEVMRMRSTRVSEDPWAVVTHAVELTLIYESRAEGLLCSTGQARKTVGLDYHDAERFADRESEIADYHPAFHFYAKMADPYAPKPDESEDLPTNAFFALEDAVTFFKELGWRDRDARLGLECIAARLSQCGDPRKAYVSLRRDGTGPGWLDVDQHGWLTMLRAVLGDPHIDYANTDRGRGILLRLCSGEILADLFDDRRLADAVEAIATNQPVPKQTDKSHV